MVHVSHVAVVAISVFGNVAVVALSLSLYSATSWRRILRYTPYIIRTCSCSRISVFSFDSFTASIFSFDSFTASISSVDSFAGGIMA